jgi:hypothetical protein
VSSAAAIPRPYSDIAASAAVFKKNRLSTFTQLTIGNKRATTANDVQRKIWRFSLCSRASDNSLQTKMVRDQ